MNLFKSTKILPLSLIFLLTACQEPQIEGTWNANSSTFDINAVNYLFSQASEELSKEKISVSSKVTKLEDHNVFYVSLKDPNITKQTIEDYVKKIESFLATLNTTVTLTLSDISDISKAKDQKEKELFGLLQRTQREQTGSFTAQLDWTKAEIVVFSQSIDMEGFGTIRTSTEFGYTPLYCQLNIPLSSNLPSLEITEFFPKMEKDDIPSEILATLSKEKIKDYLDEENNLRDGANLYMQTNGITYPHEITFSDDFLNKLSVDDTLFSFAALGYHFEENMMVINYGMIEGVKHSENALNIDMNGTYHNLCHQMIAKETPEIERKMKDAEWLDHITGIRVNPKWSPNN